MEEELKVQTKRKKVWQEIKHRAEVRLDEINASIEALGGNANE